VRVTRDNPPGVPAPVGNYSHVARVELGDAVLLVVSGQLALGEDGELIGAGGMAEQTERVFEVLVAILAAQGASFADVVGIRTFLTDMSRLGEYAAVRRTYLPGDPPASTTVEVSGLAVAGALVEVEAMAVVHPPKA